MESRADGFPSAGRVKQPGRRSLLSEHLPEVTDGHELRVDGIGIERGNVHLLIGDRALSGFNVVPDSQPPGVEGLVAAGIAINGRPS